MGNVNDSSDWRVFITIPVIGDSYYIGNLSADKTEINERTKFNYREKEHEQRT